jgi:MFS family permease
MFQIAYMVTAPTVGKTLPKVGRKNMIILGYIITIASTVSFGICYHIPKERLKVHDEATGKDIYV